jgi:guanylate kinase
MHANVSQPEPRYKATVNGFLVTVTGPTGSGKTTFVQAMVDSGHFAQLISHTTRPPRPGEVDGVHYYFTSRKEFTKKFIAAEFIQTVEFSGNLYGTSTEEVSRVQAIGKTPVVIVEPSGISQFGEYCTPLGLVLLPLFLESPTETLMERYLSRLAGEVLLAKDVAYHSKRLSTIGEESTLWRGEVERQTSLCKGVVVQNKRSDGSWGEFSPGVQRANVSNKKDLSYLTELAGRFSDKLAEEIGAITPESLHKYLPYKVSLLAVNALTAAKDELEEEA